MNQYGIVLFYTLQEFNKYLASMHRFDSPVPYADLAVIVGDNEVTIWKNKYTFEDACLYLRKIFSTEFIYETKEQ